MKKALKLFVSFLILIIVSAVCIVLGFGVLIGLAYLCSLLAKVAVLGVILKIIAYGFCTMIAVLLLIGGTLETYERVFKARCTRRNRHRRVNNAKK